MVTTTYRRSRATDWIGLISFGFFLMLIGAIWIMTPGLYSDVIDFFNHFELKTVTGNISLPAPMNPHPIAYTAAMQFCFAFGAFQIAVLIMRFALHDRLSRKADAVSGIAFWFSSSYFWSLLANETIGWFAFLAGVIISGGLAILASSMVKIFR